MNLSVRLKQLEAKMGRRLQATAFRLKDGGIFRVELDPLTYLLQNGVETPRGIIVGIDLPAGEIDPVTKSLYETIDQMIQEGRR